MAINGDGVMAYFEQWLKTATKEQVVAEMAWSANRIKFKCKTCGDELVVNRPESTNSVSYRIQEFVKIHSHVGGHTSVSNVKSETAKTPIPVAVTADFKYVNLAPKELAFKPGMIDAYEVQAKLIKSQVTKYLAEGNPDEASKHQAQLNKIKLLQAKKVVEEGDKKKIESGDQETLQYKKLTQYTVLKVKEIEDEKKSEDKTIYYSKSFLANLKTNVPWSTKSNFNSSDYSANKDFAYVDGKKVYWKRDADGNVIGILKAGESWNPTEPEPPKKLKRPEGRKFR